MFRTTEEYLVLVVALVLGTMIFWLIATDTGAPVPTAVGRPAGLAAAAPLQASAVAERPVGLRPGDFGVP